MLGQIELLLGSTGRGVCAEAYMPDGELARLLASAKGELANRLSEDLMPRGWWPLLDSKLVASATPRVSWEGWRPILRVPARPQPNDRSSAHEPPRHGSDARRVIKNTLRRYHLDQFFDTFAPV